jgi:hypothetical protein
MMESSEIRGLVDRLRSEGRALEGDGFGRVGYLKSGYKKVAKQLEEFALLLEMPEPEEVKERKGERLANPDCYGEYGENVPDCQCRKIFELASSSEEEQTLDKG